MLRSHTFSRCNFLSESNSFERRHDASNFTTPGACRIPEIRTILSLNFLLVVNNYHIDSFKFQFFFLIYMNLSDIFHDIHGMKKSFRSHLLLQ